MHSATTALNGTENLFALAAAISLKLRPHTTLGLVAAGTVSPDGRCKTFDARANGYARAEALGVTALQTQIDDRCTSARVGCALVRHDGRSASLTAPNGTAQRMLLTAAWAVASLSSQLCMEAHGTGTALGDPIEVSSLASAWASTHEGMVPISSHKALTGHAEAPSGVSLHCSPARWPACRVMRVLMMPCPPCRSWGF